MPVQIFFCYAHEDELLLKKLKTHLKPLQRQGLIDLWHDRDIIAGTDWQREISKHLNEAQIILLLVSSDFMESDYCYGIEMKRALERQECGEKCVIPIIIRHVYWQAALGKLQALPTDGIPVTDPYWHDWDRAFFDVAKGIRRAAENWIDKIRWLDEGNAQYKAREYAKALAAYGEALRIDASFAKAYNGKGDVLRDLRRNEEALVAYERATAFKPDYMWAWHNIGIVLHRIRRYEEAIAPFERAIELDPANVWPWFEKGQALRYLRRFEEALISYERASELDPNNRHAWQNKGKVLFELERYEESLEAYKKAILLGLSPSDHYCYIVRTLNTLGLAKKVALSKHGSTKDSKGHYWHYSEISFFSHPDTGIYGVSGTVKDKWASLDWERGFLGYPISEQEATADGTGCYIHFEHGSIYWTTETGAHEIHGEIRNQWARIGWEQSFLGYPTTDEMNALDNIGRISYFQFGAIYYSPQKHTVLLRGLSQNLQERFSNIEVFTHALERASQPVKLQLFAVVFHIDHPSDKNRGYYRIGRILDANGIAAGGWSKQIEVPSEIAKDNQGTDIALTDLDRNGSPDLIVFHIGHKKDTNYGFYQIGKNFDEKGIAPGNWSEPIQVPGSLGRQNQGAGIAVTDLNRSGYPDFIIFYIDSSIKGENRGYYRIGRDLNADGIINSGWSEPIPVPGSFGTGNHCASITVADLDGNGRLDLIVFYIDPQEEKSLGYYRIGKHIDVNGIVTAGWSEPILVLDPFNSQNHGASIAIADLNRNGRPDLIVFHIEHPPKGENRGYYRVGKNLDAKGFATGGWSKPILVPGWFGTRNQGAGIVFTMLV